MDLDDDFANKLELTGIVASNNLLGEEEGCSRVAVASALSVVLQIIAEVVQHGSPRRAASALHLDLLWQEVDISALPGLVQDIYPNMRGGLPVDCSDGRIAENNCCNLKEKSGLSKFGSVHKPWNSELTTPATTWIF